MKNFIKALSLICIGILAFGMVTGCGNNIAETELSRNARVGDSISFGTYPQLDRGTNYNAPIEWLILAKDGYKALLISRYALDCEPFNSDLVEMTWEKCTLRSWLNSSFLNRAFAVNEQSAILTTNVPADANPDYGTSAGNSTQDKIFLLSVDEANKYFSDNAARKCVCFDYAKEQGVNRYDVDYNGRYTCNWTLRTPGSILYYTAYVNCFGQIETNGAFVNYPNHAIRPAMWVDLRKIP